MRVARTAGGRLLNNGMRVFVVAAALGAMALQGRQRRPHVKRLESPKNKAVPASKEDVAFPQAPLQEQKERAGETRRGRSAVAPWQIPWLGWKDILWRTY